MLEEDFGEQLPEDAKKIVQRIGRSTERLEKMIGDVLTFSRMTLQPIAKEVVDVEAIIRVTLEHDSELQPPKATIYVQSPLPKLIGHEASLTQCVSNLLRNAVKFVAPGVKPQVTIRAQQSGANVQIWFEDNGIGIAAKEKVRL